MDAMQFLRLIFLDEKVKEVRISMRLGNQITVWTPQVIEDVRDRMESNGYTKLILLGMDVTEGSYRNSINLRCRAE